MAIKRPKKQAGQGGDIGEEVRNITLAIRLNSKELSKIEDKFKKSGQKTLAKFCRENLLSGKSISDQQTNSQTVQILYALSKIGTNINQIARRLNTEKSSWNELTNELKINIDELKRLQKNYK